MKVHHLNCATMQPSVGEIVCHVLLLETDTSLVLVDTGFGLADIADPRRIGPMRHLLKPVLDDSETAIRQIEALGLDPRDVCDIVVTHFDMDHIGGLADFPDARIHVSAPEARGAVHSPNLYERFRYRSSQWSHGPRLVEHEPSGDDWRGFSTTRALTDVADGIVLVGLVGHSRGHCAVAVDTGEGWLLHAGDAYMQRAEVTGGSGVPAPIRLMEYVEAHSRRQWHTSREQLAELIRTDPDVEVFCAHDPAELAARQATSEFG